MPPANLVSTAYKVVTLTPAAQPDCRLCWRYIGGQRQRG